MAQSRQYPITTIGGAGAATNSAAPLITDMLWGVLSEIIVDYAAGAPATTVVQVEVNKSDVWLTIITLAAGNTDRVVVPVNELLSAGDVGLGQYVLWNLNGHKLRVTVTLSDALAPAVTIQFGGVG